MVFLNYTCNVCDYYENVLWLFARKIKVIFELNNFSFAENVFKYDDMNWMFF